ncbi:MAG TPA: 16S rRNA (guanine(527)-N(7))-methyltransferase RsmG [Microbacteriaceae bacterium]|nr:16S rRNA (guanine(527)-N(7))-methyltransferase RsmG [Microbacteriaceae bacterium]
MTEREPEPEVTQELFSDEVALRRVRHFVAQLAEQGETRGLIGPLELPRIWSRHILNSALLAPLVRPGRVGDVGTGAGLPGLVLAIARPDAEFVLIEPMARRVEWLEEQVSELGLDNVTVVRGRAEDTLEFRALDQVTARAVSALRTLIPLTARLVRPGGELLLLKGAAVETEIEAARKVIAKWKLENIRVEQLGLDIDVEPTRVFRADVR